VACIDVAYDAVMTALFGVDPLTWPEVDAPGFPPLLVQLLTTFNASLDIIASFLPPDPENLPEIPLPDFFVSAFTTGDIPIPTVNFEMTVGGLPFTINIPGVSIDIPPVPEGMVQPWTTDALIKLIEGLITIPFELAVKITESVIELNLEIPGFDFVDDLLRDVFSGVSFPEPTVNLLSMGLSQAITDLLECKLG
jgi:hypothetical protein